MARTGKLLERPPAEARGVGRGGKERAVLAAWTGGETFSLKAQEQAKVACRDVQGEEAKKGREAWEGPEQAE